MVKHWTLNVHDIIHVYFSPWDRIYHDLQWLIRCCSMFVFCTILHRLSWQCASSWCNQMLSFIDTEAFVWLFHGPLTIYAKLRVAHAPGMPGTFSPAPTSKETASKQSRHASRHVRHARAVMYVRIANPRWRGKRSRHSRRMRNPQVYVSVKRPIACEESVTNIGQIWKHNVTQHKAKFVLILWMYCMAISGRKWNNFSRIIYL